MTCISMCISSDLSVSQYMLLRHDTTVVFILLIIVIITVTLYLVQVEDNIQMLPMHVVFSQEMITLKSLRSENHTPIIIGLTEVNQHRSHKNSLKKQLFHWIFGVLTTLPMFLHEWRHWCNVDSRLRMLSDTIF